MAVHIDAALCLACGECVERCILDNLRVRRPACWKACPLGVNGQAISMLIAMGRVDDAAREIRRCSVLPETLAIACDGRCEARCARGEKDRAVRVRALAQFALEQSAAAPDPPPPGGAGRRAIVGATPAGLQAAFDLRREGIDVVLYEERDSLEAALEAASKSLPSPLPGDALARDLERFAALGVDLRLGEFVNPNALVKEFGPVFLASFDDGERNEVVEVVYLSQPPSQGDASLSVGRRVAPAQWPPSLADELASGRRMADVMLQLAQGRGLSCGTSSLDTRLPNPVEPDRSPLSADAARKEASRCLRCGAAFEKYEECWYCLPCEIECPTDALRVDMPFLVA